MMDDGLGGRRVFAGAVADGGVVKAIRVPDGKRISNSRIKPKGDIANEAVAAGAAGLAYIRVLEGGEIDAAKPIKEGLSAAQVADVIAATGAQAVSPCPGHAHTHIHARVHACLAACPSPS